MSYPYPVTSDAPWQYRGETIALRSALCRYDLTEHEIHSAGLECKYKYCYGSSYPMFKCFDLKELEKTIVPERKAYTEKYGAKLGPKEWTAELERRRAAGIAAAEEEYAKERKAREERATLDAKQREFDAKKKDIETKLTHLATMTTSVSLEGAFLSKTAAKTDWGLKDKDLAGLATVQKGYAAKDVIEAAMVHKSEAGLASRFSSKKPECLKLLTAYSRQRTKTQLDERYSKDLVMEVYNEIMASHTAAVEDADAKVKAATKMHDQMLEELKVEAEKPNPSTETIASLKRRVTSRNGRITATSRDRGWKAKTRVKFARVRFVVFGDTATDVAALADKTNRDSGKRDDVFFDKAASTVSNKKIKV